MRHRKHTFKIGRSGAHRKAMLANMACSLIYYNEIKTTVTKAKEARRFADKLVTLGKKSSLADTPEARVHFRRLAVSKLRDKEAAKVLFDEIAPKYAKRNGGYTRLIRIGDHRNGDAAELCILQWVEEEIDTKSSKKKKAGKKASAPKTPQEKKSEDKTEETTDAEENVTAQEVQETGASEEEKDDSEAKEPVAKETQSPEKEKSEEKKDEATEDKNASGS